MAGVLLGFAAELIEELGGEVDQLAEFLLLLADGELGAQPGQAAVVVVEEADGGRDRLVGAGLGRVRKLP